MANKAADKTQSPWSKTHKYFNSSSLKSPLLPEVAHTCTQCSEDVKYLL